MIFHVTWTFHSPSEETTARSLAVFAQWKPPEEANFLGFYGTADGSGGVAIIEVPDAAALAKTTAPWTAWLDFTATPILPIEEATVINVEALNWVTSVK